MSAPINQLKNGLLNIAGLLVMVLVGGLAALNTEDGSSRLMVSILAGAVPVLFILFTIVSQRSTLLFLFWLETFSIFLLYVLVSEPYIAILSIVWVVQASELLSKRKATGLLIANILFFTASQIYHFGLENLISAFVNATLFGLFQVFAYATTQRAIGERVLREESRALNRELLATRELLSQTTAQSERLRIARDLHDILGHHMTALILNLEVAKHIAAGDTQEKTQAKVLEKIEQSHSLAKLLLGDIRSAVGELRDDDCIDLEQSLQKLTLGIPNLNIHIDLSQAPPLRSVELAETILRCAQESITNVVRHASASECNISLHNEQSSCHLRIKDNGSTAKAIEPGNGLKGMTERVQALGGTLSWSTDDGSFRLHAEFPLGTSQ